MNTTETDSSHEIPKEPPQLSGRPWVLYVVGAAVLAVFAIASVLMVVRKDHATAAEAKDRGVVSDKGARLLVAKVSMSPPQRVVIATGDVRPYQQTQVYSKVSGYLRALRVDRGDKVKAGQILGIVESPEAAEQVASARSNLTLKQQNLERTTPLAKEGVASKAELDRANAEMKMAEADLSRFASLQGYQVIKAPFAGVITARFADLGSLLPAATSSTQAAQPLVELTDMSRLRISSYLGQADAPLVKVGTPVTIRTDDGIEVQATVTRSSQAFDTKTRTMLTESEVANEPARIYPGSFVSTVFTFQAPAAPSVPLEAVFIKGGKTFVAIVRDGVAHFAPVETGETDGRTVRVFSGVAAGDVVGLYVGDAITDGSRVDAVERAPAKAPAAAGSAAEPAKK